MRWVVGLLVLLFTACMRPTQAVMEDVHPYRWQEAAEVRFENGDTTTLRDLRLVVRSNREFRNDSLRLKITLLNPDSAHYSEVVAAPMQHPHMPAALHLTDEIPYRRGVVLNRLGEYRILIEPQEEVRGVEAVGINIVKSE